MVTKAFTHADGEVARSYGVAFDKDHPVHGGRHDKFFVGGRPVELVRPPQALSRTAQVTFDGCASHDERTGAGTGSITVTAGVAWPVTLAPPRVSLRTHGHQMTPGWLCPT